MKSSYDHFHQRQINIRKGAINEQARLMMNKYYRELFELLVYNEFDGEVFNDTYIRITSEYNEEQDFKELFIKRFNQLKGGYWRGQRTMNGALLELEENMPIIDDEPEEETATKDDEETIDKFLEYANNLQTKE